MRFLHLLSRLLDEAAASHLFDLFNIVAVLPYEEVETSGTLALCPPDEPLPAMLVRFETPFHLRHVRGVRKCLHIAGENLCLVSDCRSACGFTARDQLNGELFFVEFRRAGIWELSRNGHIVLTVAAPAHNSSRTVDRQKLERELCGTFPQLSGEQVTRLCDLAGAAARQTQGANVLISRDAALEARRLASQCTLIEPTPFTPMLMEQCTSIDGTVIIDTDGICYAIGAILDGGVSDRGDRTRGGRYNSALMYVDTVTVPSVILVVSRDGTVDIVSSSGKESFE